MDKIVNSYVKKFKEKRRKKRQMAMLLSVPALFLAIVVCWQLHLTGIAMTDGNVSVNDAAEEGVVYTADVVDEGDMAVTVTAPEGALPEGAELSVSLYEETSEEYAAAAESIDYDADDEETAMAALDISFLADGEEVEPSEPVMVNIDITAVLPEDADLETVEVSHLCETEDGVEAELVADATDETEGTVDPETGMVEFEAESFSTFTITCSYLAQSDGETDQQTQTSTSYFTDTADVEEGDNLTVTVTAPEGALPEGAELSVTLYDETCEEYTAAGESIDYDADDEETGMAAMDISFLVDGEEVEPSEPVTVSIDVSAILPEDADIETVEVSHLCETEDGVEAELVADATDETKGTVDTETGVAEFEVESFSSFTITWSANTNDSSAITTTCYFSSDGENYTANDDLVPAGISSSNLWVGYDNEVDFDDSNSLLEVDGYTLDHAVLYVPNNNNDYTKYKITNLRATYDWSSNWTYQYSTDNGSNWTSFTVSVKSEKNQNTAYLYLYYNVTDTELTGELSITDEIENTGFLVATYTGSEVLTAGDYYYKWYKLNTDTGKYELIEGEIEKSLAVYVDGARETYKVELVSTVDDSVIATSNTYQVPYYSQIQNGSFESPSISGSAQLTNGLYSELVWKTTGFGSLNTSKHADGQDIEIVNASGSGSNYGESTAADGKQYAELNCEYAGTLYQDVMTIPDVPLYWKLAHEGRDGTDSMCVIIVDAEFADKHITTQEDVTAVYNAALTEGLTESTEDEYSSGVTFSYTVDDEIVSITVWLIKTDNVDWAYYYGTYQVPEGQYLTRFLFGAVSTAGNDMTVGNLLDDISLSQTPPTSSISGNITVTKTAEGVDEDEIISAGTYKFTVKNSSGTVIGTVSLPTADATISQTYYWTYTLTNIIPANYNVTENNYVLNGYNYISTTSNPGGNTGTTSANFTVNNGSTTSVSFTNKYNKPTTKVILKKVDADKTSVLLDGAVFALSTDGSEDQTLTLTDGKVSIDGLICGTQYTLTETTAPDGYNLLTEPIVFRVSSDGTVTFTSGSDVASYSTDQDGFLVITVKNTAGYELPETGGPGTWPYILIGLLLSGTAISLLYRRRRRAGTSAQAVQVPDPGKK